MPAHASHLLQPLDVGVFSPLKGAYGKRLEDRMDPEHVLSKLAFQLRTPTPPLVEGSISSAFQTPQNTRQLDQKVRSLQNSLNKRRQLPSSPIAHTRHLEKAAQMAM